MAEPLRLLPPRVPITDPRTGQMTRDWYLFFMQLYERVGGANGASSDDLSGSLFEDAGTSELFAQVNALSDCLHQRPQPEQSVLQEAPDPGVDTAQVYELSKEVQALSLAVSAMRSEYAELLKEIDALKQAIQS